MTTTSGVVDVPEGARASHRRADIQGLRALAVALVVAYHIGLPLPGGFTGVDMFFVVSGYVISESLLREYRATGQIRFGQFFLRRFKRLFPVLLVVVAVTLVLAVVFLPPFANENQALYTGLGAIGISANVVIEFLTGDYFAQDSRINPLLHTWSLSVEEQFYLLFPLIVTLGFALGRRLGSERRGLFVLVGAMSLLSFALAVVGARIDLPVGNSLLGFYSPITRAWEFGVGVLLSVGGSTLIPRGRVAPPVLAGLGALLVGLGAFTITSDTPFPGVWALLPVIGTALLIAAGGAQESQPVTWLLARRPMVWLGNLSYSFYLWHWPFIVFVGIGWSGALVHTSAAAAVALAVSWLSYRFIEQPLRQRPTPRPQDVARYVTTVLAVPGMVIGSTWLVATQVIQPVLEEEIGSPLLISVAEDNRCLSSNRFDEEWAKRCTWFADSAGQPVYLIGDSTATHLDEGLLVAAEALDRPVSIWNGILCIPLSSLQVIREGRPDREHCPVYQSFIDDRLAQAEPGTVIIAFSDTTQWNTQIDYVLSDGRRFSDPNEKGSAVYEPLVDEIVKLQSVGHEVVVVYPIPNFRTIGPGYDPRSCAIWELFDDTCAPRVSRSEMLELQQTKRDAIARATAETETRTLDLFDRYCGPDTCSPSREGFLTYFDDIHISVEESLLLAPLWEDILR